MTPASPPTPPGPDPDLADPGPADPMGPVDPGGPSEADLRAAFARAALDVTPGPVPLAAVRRAGRSRRRRRTTALSALSMLAVATAAVAVVALTPVRPSPPLPGPAAVPSTAVPTASHVAPPPQVPAPPPAPIPVRVVAPGERVNAGKGWTVWLTEEGKHWSGPDGYENVRSVTDGNVDTGEPGVSHQSEGDATRIFHSGLYYGTRTAGRVELTGAGGRRTVAALLELPGRPGWGVWYASTRPEDQAAGLALYDRAGELLAELPPM
ncbi:hypothetical protein ABT034_19790 [Streptomyces sp. NPDC002773]|uniref:hypothetical protein n=1 Tax=Streptomyces sp. NPDC002773 TaxID=3154430 RepID=UPI00331927BF